MSKKLIGAENKLGDATVAKEGGSIDELVSMYENMDDEQYSNLVNESFLTRRL
jgi:hypothetical protein